MLAKITAAAAMTIVLAGSAMASGSTVSQLHNQQTMNTWHNVYVDHGKSGQHHAANSAPNGYTDEQGSHALGGGPG